MKVVVFEPTYNSGHRKVLRAFAKGVEKSGQAVEILSLGKYVPCDIAVIFGAVKEAYPPTWPKREILNRHTGRRLIMIESAFINRGKYWQIGFGGFAGSANFRNENMPKERWLSFGVTVQPWSVRDASRPKIVCGQIPWDTQVQYVDHVGWCRNTVAKLTSFHTPVLFRPHPRLVRNGRADSVYTEIPKELWDHDSLEDSLNKANCFVTWNSTAAVDALIAGVPVVTFERSSIAWPMGSHTMDPNNIELRYPAREQWFYNLAYAQWTLKEMKKGLPWRHLMRP
jgi:hypothetical protein